MKYLVAVCLGLVSFASGGSAYAQGQDWRSCAVTICSKGQCEGPNSNLIVVAPADFSDPGFGGEAVMLQQLEALSERLYPSARGWTREVECKRQYSEGDAQEVAKAYIQLAQTPPAAGEIKIANPFEVWKYSSTSVASNTTSLSSSASASPEPASAPKQPEKAQAQTATGPGEPMHFIMWVDLREPINGVNALCFHAIKTKPAPEGYRGNWPTLKNALPIIQGYFPLMLENCRRYGTPVSANVGFATDDVSPATKREAMEADVKRWRKLGFPEVFISN